MQNESITIHNVDTQFWKWNASLLDEVEPRQVEVEF